MTDNSATAVDEAYARLPGVGPHAARLGGALITWVEPMPEHVVGYNRWYEDDHMITGAMAMPWMFSCRRFVAPRSLQHLRAPAGSRVAVPLEAGKYIGVYWINEGRLDDHMAWALGANIRLHAEGRGSYRGAGHDPLEERRHVFTAFCDYLGPVYRDPSVPLDLHALVQPYQGLVVELYDAAGDRGALDRWLAEERLPEVVAGPVALATRFAPRPLPDGSLGHVAQVAGVDQAVCVLYFLDVDPRECWEERFAPSLGTAASAGAGSLAVQAAFIPTRHGTDAYTDGLF